jgi:protein associated with RNAse G/E
MVIEKKDMGIKIMERDRHRQLNEHAKEVNKHKKEMQLSRSLKKEVVAGANGTQDYIIKEGPNKGKIADKGQ